jgi:hypothetical protein
MVAGMVSPYADGVAETWLERVTNDFIAAFNSRDWDAVRNLLADDLLVEDRRPARGFGDTRGADDFVLRLKASIEAVPDRVMGESVWLARTETAGVARNDFRGHDAIGGGEIASDRVAVTFTANGRYTRFAFFEVDDEAEALAFFEGERD